MGMGFETMGVAGEQALAVGITVKTTFSTLYPVFAKVLLIFPDPLAVCGTTLAELPVAVQVKVLPGTADDSWMFNGKPEQRLGVM